MNRYTLPLISITGVLTFMCACSSGASKQVTTPVARSLVATSTSPLASPTPTPTSAAPSGAVQAFRTWVTNLNAHNWAANYGFLVSDQQHLITRGEYVTCEDSIGESTPILTWDKLLDVASLRYQIPGTDTTKASTAVTVQLDGGGQQTSVTAHMFSEAGVWKWSLEPQALAQCGK